MGNNEYYTFGYDLFGPFLYGFTKWLRDRIVSNGDTKIFFFSRDGYIMQKAYLLFEEKAPLRLEQSYVYFSRNSLRRSLLWKCDSYEESLQYLSKERFTEFAEVMSYYGLTHEEVLPLMKKTGAEWNEVSRFEHLAHNNKVRSVYETFKSIIDERSRLQYDTVIAYLKQIGMQGQCAIVDIGWHGTMQYYLEKLIENSGIDAKINGYYVGHHSYVPVKGGADGFVYNQDNLTYKNQIRCFFGLGEKLFQSLEGSTDHYLHSNGKVEAVLKPYEYENDRRMVERINLLHSGALDFVREGIKHDIRYESFSDAFLPLLRFGMSPSYNQTRMFRSFYNSDGGKVYYIPQKPLYEYSVKEFFRALVNSPWKTGFMKAAFRIPFPYYWIYSFMRR